MKPFCDHVGVTIPVEYWDALRLDISPELDSIGMGVEMDSERAVLWRDPAASGTVRAERIGKVWKIGTSGAVCAGLRSVGRFESYLAAIGSRPHRVTRLDASVDLKVDAAPIVAKVTRQGQAGELQLTRKAVPPRDVLNFSGVRVDGAVSGTVYVGAKRADVRMVIYDKRHERISRKLPDVGDLTRYELRLRSRCGVTLRDAAEPAGVFWHYASPEFLPCPSGTPAWVPGGSGFELTKTAPELPAARLRRRVDASAELSSLLALAHECGPYGVEFLCSLIRARSRGAGVSPAGAAVALCGAPGTPDAVEVLSPAGDAHAPTETGP